MLREAARRCWPGCARRRPGGPGGRRGVRVDDARDRGHGGLAARPTAPREAVAAEPFPGVGAHHALRRRLRPRRGGRRPSELFRLADGALYWAKHHGRDVTFLYSPEVVEVLSAAEHAERLERAARPCRASACWPARWTRRTPPRGATPSGSPSLAAGPRPGARLAADDAAAAARRRPRARRRQDRACPTRSSSSPAGSPPPSSSASRPTPRWAPRSWPTCSRAEQVAWVRGHHERWDGRGYPDGLAAEAIPEGARILTLADAWDVMTSDRPYGVPLRARTPWPSAAAARAPSSGPRPPRALGGPSRPSIPAPSWTARAWPSAGEAPPGRTPGCGGRPERMNLGRCRILEGDAGQIPEPKEHKWE